MPRWQLTHQDEAQGMYPTASLAADRCMLFGVLQYRVSELCAGILEGVATTAVFRFKDDFVFVLRRDSAGNTIVQGRSKSRIGSSDLGANAKRIKQYFQKVAAHLQSNTA